MRYKKVNNNRLNLTGLTEEEKIAKKTKHNTDEYEKYKDAGEWLDANSEYVRYSVNKLLGYYKYSQFKSFRLDLHQEAFIVVLNRFPKYKPGLRSVSSWLYQQIHWYIAKLLKRKYIKYYSRTVGFPDMSEKHIDYSYSPEMLLIDEEDRKIKESRKRGRPKKVEKVTK